jgi:hypothetical protein
MSVFTILQAMYASRSYAKIMYVIPYYFICLTYVIYHDFLLLLYVFLPCASLTIRQVYLTIYNLCIPFYHILLILFFSYPYFYKQCFHLVLSTQTSCHFNCTVHLMYVVLSSSTIIIICQSSLFFT